MVREEWRPVTVYGLYEGGTDDIVYVGSTRNPRTRLNEHRSPSNQGVKLSQKCNLPFVEWLMATGARVQMKTLEVCSESDRWDVEAKWTRDMSPKYNRAIGREMPKGEDSHQWGRKHTKEWKEAMSQRKRGPGHHFYGKTFTPEHRAKIARPGTQNPNAILNADQVREIRKRLEAGDFQKDIARDYNVQQTTISRIKIGRTYRDVV